MLWQFIALYSLTLHVPRLRWSSSLVLFIWPSLVYHISKLIQTYKKNSKSVFVVKVKIMFINKCINQERYIFERLILTCEVWLYKANYHSKL